MPDMMGLDGPSSSSSSSSTSSTTPPPQQPPEQPAEQTPPESQEKPQVIVTLKDPQAEILKKGITTAKPRKLRKP